MEQLNRRDLLAVGSALGLATLAVAPAIAADKEAKADEKSFAGRVDDLDFIAGLGWCQVILRKDGNSLVAITKEHRMQTLLELAFSTGKYADVMYKEDSPNVLTRVKVNREVPSK